MLIAATLAILAVVDACAISVLFLIFRWSRRTRPRALLFSFLAFGAAAGILAAWLWPADMSMYVNLPAVLLGDEVYTLAIRYLGDAHAADAHHTIPWLLRVPQVYVVVSIILWGLAGLLVQWVGERRQARRPASRIETAVRR